MAASERMFLRPTLGRRERRNPWRLGVAWSAFAQGTPAGAVGGVKREGSLACRQVCRESKQGERVRLGRRYLAAARPAGSTSISTDGSDQTWFVISTTGAYQKGHLHYIFGTFKLSPVEWPRERRSKTGPTGSEGEHK